MIFENKTVYQYLLKMFKDITIILLWTCLYVSYKQSYGINTYQVFTAFFKKSHNRALTLI
jgi:hypothetical protein